jgi:protein SCO1/2
MKASLIASILLSLTYQASAATSPATIAADVGIDQHLGAQVPADLSFSDETGQTVSLSRYFGGDGAKPTLLVLVYYSCPDLCPITLSHLTQGLNGIALEAGRDFRIVVVSFDPQDTPSQAISARTQYLRAYRGAGQDGWHFLTGTQAAIERLRQAVGFRCTFEGGRNRFAHAAGVMVVTPGGRLSHYFFGTDYSPADLEAGLKDATRAHATLVRQPDQQYCFAYDPRAGKYGKIITRALQTSGALWVLALGGYIGLKLAQDLRGRPLRRPK